MTSSHLHAVPAAAAHHAAPEFCPSCKTRLGANFCPQCGQEAVLHPPSMGEFVAEFIGHYVAIEGKLWRTMGQLLLRPGGLTKAYMAGLRVNYMQPLRLFLTLSVILFSLLQFDGFSIGENGAQPARSGDTRLTAGVTQTDTEAPPAVLPAGTSKYEVSLGYYSLSLVYSPKDFAFGFGLTLPDSDKPSIVWSALRAVSPEIKQKLKRFGALPPGEQAERMTHGFFARMPYVMFFMVPVLALYLKLLYLPSRRPYGEYLLFGLHVSAFAFFIMMLMHAVPGLWGMGALVLWLMLYVGRAMHNVYGGAPLGTVVRWLVLSVAYLATLGVLITQLMLVMAVTSA